MFTEACMSPSSTIHGWKGVSRPPYSSLRRHKRRFSNFSNKKSKWISLKKRYSNLQNYCANNSRRQQCYKRDEAEAKKNSENMNRYKRTCIEAIECIHTLRIECSSKLLKRSGADGLKNKWRMRLMNYEVEESKVSPDVEATMYNCRKFSLQIRQRRVSTQQRQTKCRLTGRAQSRPRVADVRLSRPRLGSQRANIS